MSIQDILLSEFSKFFDKDLAKELIECYQTIKEAYFIRKYDYVGSLAGQFFETTLKVIQNVKFGIKPNDKGIDFERTFNKIFNCTKNTLEDETLCQIIPLIAKGGYTLRSKKRITHSRGISPNHIDGFYFTLTADWIMSELIRLYHTMNDSEVEKIIQKITKRDIPIIQEIGGDTVILDKNISASNSILLLTHSKGGCLSQDELKTVLKKYYSPSNITKYIRHNINERRIHLDKQNQIHLTEVGLNFIINKFSKLLLS